jgi:hypothetical protein
MLIRMVEWERIRGNFTQAEKDSMNSVITGEVLCPRAITLDNEALTPELREKLRLTLERDRGKTG